MEAGHERLQLTTKSLILTLQNVIEKNPAGSF